MPDNLTPFDSIEYDAQAEKRIPFYREIHRTVINTVRSTLKQPYEWLDTGCGTGSLVLNAAKEFKNASFFLADPAENMLNTAKGRNPGIPAYLSGTAELRLGNEKLDVISAVFAHHYLSDLAREAATLNCFRMLKSGGIYITFENVRPLSPKNADAFLDRWGQYQRQQGLPEDVILEHRLRYNTAYFPISIPQHLDLLTACGFKNPELIWFTNMQAGFMAQK